MVGRAAVRIGAIAVGVLAFYLGGGELAKSIRKAPAPSSVHDLLNHRMPDFVVFDAAGTGSRLSELLGNEHTVILAFSLKCTSCLAMASDWTRVSSSYSDHTFIGLACDNSRAEFDRFRARSTIEFELRICEEATIAAMNVRLWPAILEIDRSGQVRFAAEGDSATERLESFLASDSPQ